MAKSIFQFFILTTILIFFLSLPKVWAIDMRIFSFIDPFDEEAEVVLKKSNLYLNQTWRCEDAVNNHLSIIADSEKYISTLVLKESVELGPYEIDMLQKILTNRYLHLKKMSEATCLDPVISTAMIVFDLNTFGNNALKDDKLRRIIFNFSNFKRYKLLELNELYQKYTSDDMIRSVLTELYEKKIILPEALKINLSMNDEIGFFHTLDDFVINTVTGAVSIAARGWGALSDQLKWRNGRLNHNQKALEILQENLKPLDLIYEKREFVLTNYTIPGHWGHIAIWLGTKEELIKMGIWDKDFFKPFQEQIEQGKNIVEIRKKGVNFVSLIDMLNLDEIAITRVKNVSLNTARIYNNLSEQLDKAYNFKFNVQINSKITCSEFVAYSFGNIHWKETKALGQIVITPDDMAILTLYQNSPMKFILYLTGQEDNSFLKKSLDDWKKLFQKKENEDFIYRKAPLDLWFKL